MNKNIRFVLLALVAAVGFLLWNSFFILNEGQQAVITQFGKPVGRPHTSAGLKFKLPFIQYVHFFEKKILIWNGDSNQIPTNDKTYIYMENTARWRISDALRFMQAVGTEARARTLLDDILDGTVRDLVNKNDLIEIIRSSDWSPDYVDSTLQTPEDMQRPKHGRDQISQMVLEAAAKITPQYGIELIDVMFKRVNYIDTVRLRVYDRMISERKRIAAEKRATGEGQKAEILGRVDREFKSITSAAQKQSLEIRGAADAEATRIYAEAYNLDPEFYAFQKSLESYRSILGKQSTLMLDPASDLLRYMETPTQKR
ncbi:MAG: protease modulator HflC [bacterium]|nr:protease modulator HflC [bacterium]